MPIKPRPDWEVEIIREDDDAEESAAGWSPAKGLVRGGAACVAVAAVMAVGAIALTRRRPDLVVFYKHDDAQVTFILILMGALVGFIATWLLFAAMHRGSQMIGLGPTLVVVGVMLALIVVKQVALAASGLRIPEVKTCGWDWLRPATFLKSNLGVWMGFFAAVWMLRDGDSPIDVLR